MAAIMHMDAIIADVEDMFSVDFDVVNRLAGFAAGEGFNFSGRVIGEQQVFTDPQFPGRDEFLPVFAPERMIAGSADGVR